MAVAEAESVTAKRTAEYSNYGHTGNIGTIAQDGTVYDYAYDGAERLSDVTVTGAGPASETFTYDLAGNRTTWSSAPNASTSYNLDDEIEGAGQIPYVAAEGDTVYTHDDNGNVTGKATQNEYWEYGYDVKNRLVEVKLDGASVATYGYDPFNRRLWKETGGQKTWYLYAKEGLIGEYIADSGTPPVELKTYGYLPGSSWTTNPLFQKVGEEYFWYLNDHLGTPRMMVDSNGETVWSADYEAYGKATVATGTIANNIRFPGQYYDAESGLHWNYHRYYDPGTGRYLRLDPIRVDHNWYFYAQGNPSNLIDPEGLDPVDERTGETNPVTRCHINPHNDRTENLIGGLIIGGGLVAIYAWVELPALFGGAPEGALSIGARTEAKNLAEQLALKEAQAGAGKRIIGNSVKDARFPPDEWAKMQHVHKTSDNNKNIVIHYWEQLSNGFRTGFKFKD